MAVNYTLTREQLRDAVMRKLRALGVDQTASYEDEAIVLEAIDLRLKALHQLGTLWWNVGGYETELELEAGEATVETPEDMLYPVTLSVRLNNEDHPVSIIDHRTFQAIPTKSDTGRPEVAIVTMGTGSVGGGAWGPSWGSSWGGSWGSAGVGIASALRLYPVPNQNYTAVLTYERVVDNTVASASPDVIAGALLHLKTIIAYDLADDFAVPEQRMVRLRAEYKEAESALRRVMVQKTDPQPIRAVYF